MKSSITLTALALTGSVIADDALYSKRLTKRFVDDDGNYNICMSYPLTMRCSDR